MRQKLDFRDGMTKAEREYRRKKYIEEEPSCPICGETLTASRKYFCSQECMDAFTSERD